MRKVRVARARLRPKSSFSSQKSLCPKSSELGSMTPRVYRKASARERGCAQCVCSAKNVRLCAGVCVCTHVPECPAILNLRARACVSMCARECVSEAFHPERQKTHDCDEVVRRRAKPTHVSKKREKTSHDSCLFSFGPGLAPIREHRQAPSAGHLGASSWPPLRARMRNHARK